jgi:hypothetical protein
MKRKRKIFWAMLLGILFIGPGFSAQTAAFGAQGSGAVREFGEADAILDAGGTFACVLRFPKTGIAEADKAIYDWAHTVYNVAKGHADETDSTGAQNEVRVNVGYSAFLVEGDYAGIEETGDISGSYLAHPVDVVRTFNVDIKGKRLLTVGEIMNHDTDFALALLRRKIAARYPDMAGDLKGADETWLEYSVLKPDGVEVLLPRGEFLPSYLGLQRFLLSYDELGGFLK